MFRGNGERTVLVMMALILGLVSCAKKPAYDELTKDKDMVTITSAIDTESEYLYVPMSLGAPRQVVNAYAYFQGQEKIVKLRMTEEGLQAYEVDADSKFSNNHLNETLVLTLPGSYHSYRCSENTLGECTNREEENNDAEWYEREHFVPDYANIDTHSINIDTWAVGGDCISKVGSKVISKEMVPGRINIQLENYYEVSKSESCVSRYMNLRYLGQSSFKAQFHFSLIRLKDIASENYEIVDYSNEDKTTFGFFYGNKSELDPQFTEVGSYKKNKRFMRRWNPKRKTVIYHMSETFNKPENAELKKATYKAISSINNGLAKANAGFRIQLEEPKKEVSIGDLRYNMINLIDEPLANGLLGYGPIVTNPRTGEILKAHTNMYSGVIKSALRMYWTKMVNLQNNKMQATTEEAPESTPAPSMARENNAVASNMKNIPKKVLKNLISAPLDLHELEEKLHAGHNHDHSFKKLNERASKRKAKISEAHAFSIEKYKNGVETLEKYLELEKERLAVFAESNAYSAEFFNVSKTINAIFPEIMEIEDIFVKGTQNLKSWGELTYAQRSEIEKIMVPFIYSSTLVHELGHNLGLRHNFAGSYDKQNWYSKEEAHELGFKYTPESSSMMDYVSSNFGELNVLGKYDIAALRFGYAREVETRGGKIVKIEKNLEELKEKRKQIRELIEVNKENPEMLSNLNTKLMNTLPKNFVYCTDENAGATLKCNRFDQGTNLVEIANSVIQDYEDSYLTMNFRNERTSFNVGQHMFGYLTSRYSQFERVRAVFEEWEAMKEGYGEAIMRMGCSPQMMRDANPIIKTICTQINDAIEATKIAGDFFLKILKTPHHTCAAKKIGAEEGDNRITAIFLEDLYKANRSEFEEVPKTCFDKNVKRILSNQDIPLEVIAEAGKYLNGFNDLKPGFEGSYDRAVFGTWIDKLLAMKSLVQRYSEETSNAGLGNFLNHPSIGIKVYNFIDHIVLGDRLIEPVPFLSEDKKTAYQVPYSIDQKYKIRTNDLPFFWARQFLGMDNASEISLRRVLLRNAKNFDLMLGSSTLNIAREGVNYYTVKRLDSSFNPGLTDTVTTYFDETLYGASPSNRIAYEMITSINTLEMLRGVDKKILQEVFDARTETPEEFNDSQKLAAAYNIETIEALVKLKKENPNLPDSYWDRVGDEQFKKELKIIWTASLEELEAVMNWISTKDIAPEGSSDLVKKLYEIPYEVFKSMVEGDISNKIDNFKFILKDLPSSVEPFMFD